MLRDTQSLLGLLALHDPFLTLRGVLWFVALRGRIHRSFTIPAVKNCANCLFSRSEVGGDVEQLVHVAGRVSPQRMHQPSAGRALQEGMDDLGVIDAREIGAALGEAADEVSQGLASGLSTAS